MNWVKLAIIAVLIAFAIAAASHWPKAAANIVIPLLLIAMYAVWRWRRDGY
jgi:ABC-type spermidine/putrescine transport system permease subunit I